MAGPITWRNVEAANTAPALRAMEGASSSVNSSFDIFNKLIQQRQAIDQNNVMAVDEAGKQAYLDTLQGAATPEQVEALRGNLEAQRAGLSATARAAIRGAADARLTGVRQQVVAGQQYQDSEDARRDRPREREVLALLGRGQYDGAATLANGLANPGPLLNTVNVARQAAIKLRSEQEKTAAEQVRLAAEHPVKLAQMVAATDASRAAIDASKLTTAAAASRMVNDDEDRAKAQAAAQAQSKLNLLRDAGNVFVDGVFNPSDTVGLNEFMVKNGIGNDADARSAIINRISKLGGEVDLEYVDGKNKLAKKKIPIPLSLVKQALLGASGGFLWNTDDDYADSAEENLKSSLRALSEQTLPDGRAYKQNKAVFDFDQYIQTKLNVAENPGATGKKSK